MTNFFEKLKKGMGIEIPKDSDLTEVEEENIKEEKPRKRRKPKILEIKEEKKPAKKLAEPERKEIKLEKEKWFEPEGELAVDVYQQDGEIVILAPIAGVKKEDLEVSVENEIVIIRGKRKEPLAESKKNYLYQECYWGPFSRKIILSEEIVPSRAEAVFENGILIIKIPKIEREKKRKIEIK